MFTLFFEYGANVFRGRDHQILEHWYLGIAIAFFLESFSAPALIWFYLEIKKQAPYEPIPSDPEGQPINNNSGR